MFKSLIVSLSDAYSMVLFIYVLMSWIPTSSGIVGDVYKVLGRVCEPYLSLFRRLIPPIGGMVDITPIIALLVLQFGVRFIVSLL
ncbi:YggT family protein [Eggerthellaceae bacterium zg-1084]|uniref:YggT family protein n=1 Tax=Berryella wangjianweii TaxID=2734634 RepID=A0A6M8J483_9ACTN|nr:YggT family protein [Berryella wangjianweii]NPD31438.1 YggT family protein [Berryella wangjianweii]NPD33062.1 YggT family protein [Eggerthellaceae bacterium zg-997]QKF07931.1 YggT family protein [Berryella wangjianweii]